MKKPQNNNVVEIPSATLNCIKQLLFTSDKNGVDLSSIIKDLNFGKEDDLTAINVALTYKGISPKIDQLPRFEQEYDEYQEYQFLGVSLIKGAVFVQHIRHRYKKDSDTFEVPEYNSNPQYSMDINKWLSMDTDEHTIANEIREKFAKKN